MAKSQKGSRSSGSARPRKRRLRSDGVSAWYLWVIVGVLVLVGLFMLARIMSTAPPREVILPLLASNPLAIATLTAMVGDIELDSGLTDHLPEELRARLRPVDSLIALGNWPEALEHLRKLPRTDDGETSAVIEEYTGYCLYRSVRPDHALHSFRRARAADSSRDRGRQLRLAFAAGYLFQARGFADSALIAYADARRQAPTDSLDSRLPAVLNNLALAYETTGDTGAAFQLYESVAALVDTNADSPSARVVRDNLRRLHGHRPAGGVAPDE